MSQVLDITKHGEKSLELAKKFSERIIGQPEGTEALIGALDKYESGLYDHTKPIANLLFLGPTGTGKTATAEVFAEGVFGDPTRMFKIDCAEFQHSHEIAKLIGSPPGYLGHRDTHPIITNEKIKKMQEDSGQPFCVLLFDEIEKASDSLWNLLLGILDKGTLRLGTNEIVNLSSCVVLMTSNVGSKELAAKVGNDVLGFLNPTASDKSVEELRDVAISAARRKFMPEFMNRLDYVVMFNTLTPENIKAILEIELRNLNQRILVNCTAKFLLNVSPAAKKQILSEGYSAKYNAREIKRTIEKRVTLPLARTVASGQVKLLDTVVVDYKDGEYTYFVEGAEG